MSIDDELPVGGNAGARLKGIIDRVINLEEEKKVIGEDIKEVYSEAKNIGFDTKILRKVVKRAKMEREQVIMEDELIDTYESAIHSLEGMME